ncbi:hypothetical protein A5825_000405, partial [Enterococcus gallinarum]
LEFSVKKRRKWCMYTNAVMRHQ